MSDNNDAKDPQTTEAGDKPPRFIDMFTSNVESPMFLNKLAFEEAASVALRALSAARPASKALFLGPVSAGKTEMFKQVAADLRARGQEVIELDVSKLKGQELTGPDVAKRRGIIPGMTPGLK